MQIEQKRKILERIRVIQLDLENLKQARQQALINGYASATISSGGGSKSYTKIDVAKFTEIINELNKELKDLRSLISSVNKASPKQIYTIYC